MWQEYMEENLLMKNDLNLHLKINPERKIVIISPFRNAEKLYKITLSFSRSTRL